MPTNRFTVSSQKEPAKPRKGESLCVIGRDVEIDPGALENYCFQLLSDQEFELALLAGAIAFADRSVRRRHSEGWARQIEIVMPVRQPDRWSASRPALHDLLQFLTGDYWQIEFTARRSSWNENRQDVFPLGAGRFVVVPFSNGLDSFAQSQLLKVEASHLTPVRITAWNRGLSGARDWKVDPDGTRYRRISIPVRVAANDHPEPSYRTRSFLFCIFAGIAAQLAKAEAIMIPENGQGAIGPSLVPFGAESPQRGSHPAFTRKMARFLELILGSSIRFEHPQLWRTKGEVLRVLQEENLLDGWTVTTSCPRDRRDVNLNGKTVHCGVCAGCLLRRSAAFSADLVEPDDIYLWPNIGAPTLEQAIHPDSGRKTRPNDADIANHGVLVMTELAKKADSPQEDPIIAQSAFEIACGGSMTDTINNLRRLLNAHKSEWVQFKNYFPVKGWINSNFIYL
jgi:7-cyano-7-deazaguanine synthase in queuosine biosynthesis